MKKTIKITEKDRKVAADILTQFMFTKTMDDVQEVWHNLFDKYGLKEDPFTKTPVTPEEYYDSMNEYEKQLMLQKYGYEE